jgi:HEAT repeat protein
MVIILLTVIVWATVPQDPAAVDQAWSVLQVGVDSKSPVHRMKAIHALGLLVNNHRAQQWAEKALEDPNPDVRVEAANALGRMGAVSARPNLKNELKDKEIKVVLASANSLYLLKDPAAYDVFYALLTGERKSSAGLVQTEVDTLKNRRAMEKLAFETGIGFVPFGSMGYEAWKTVTRDDATPVRVAAAAKLAHDPDSKAGEALANLCEDRKWQIRAASADAIATRGDPSLLQSLVPLLLDANDTVRSEAAGAIIRLFTAPQVRRGRFPK